MKKFYVIIWLGLVGASANAQSLDSYGKNKLLPGNNESSLLGQSSTNLLDRILTNPEYQNEFISIKQMRKERISDDEILEYLDGKTKQGLLQNKNLVSVQQSFSFHPPVINSGTCSDMGGENGWSTWVATPGSYSGGVFTWVTPGAPSAPRFNLTNGSGHDACTPGPNVGDPLIPVVAPGFGNASIQIGELQTAGSYAERLDYSLSVTTADIDFIYSYALVMQDPGHAPSDQPLVSICIKDGSGNPIPGGYFTYHVPGFYKTSCDTTITYYKPWTTVHVNLSAYIAQTLTVEIINADCGLGGHYAQSYWDFQCGSMLPASIPICMVTVDSTSTKNVVVWDKPQNVPIDSFKIYRQIASVYKHLGTIH